MSLKRILILRMKALIVFAATLMVALSALALFFWRSYDLIPEGRFHPWGLYYQARGLPVHPFVPVDEEHPIALEVWSSDLPIRRSHELSYAESFQKVATMFQNKHFNAKIKCQLFPFHDDMVALVKARLGENSWPDICISPFDPELIDPQRSVPLTAFFPRFPVDEAISYDPLALGAVTFDRQIWAWPMWFEVPCLIGNVKMLREIGLDAHRIVESGWSWDEFIAMGMKMRGKQEEGVGVKPPRIVSLALNSRDPDYAKCLLATRFPAGLVMPDGKPGWTMQGLEELANFLASLRDQGRIFVPQGNAPDGIISLFWEGRAITIGPAWSGLMRHVKARYKQKKSESIQTIFLPIPHYPGIPYQLPLRVTAAMVYMKRTSDWKERARLAVEFIQELSRNETIWVAAKLNTVPVKFSDRPGWQEAISLSYEENALLAASTRAPRAEHSASAPDISGTRTARLLEKDILNHVVIPSLEKFWTGALSAQKLAAIIDEEARKMLESR
ncbi:MAG: extracellular solute-binding protein [Firmicutes bacterium]|nr:extracellular solute-binding protein [Bacillota bacterium]